MLAAGLPIRSAAIWAPGGYDTHANQEASLPKSLKLTFDSLLAFQRDLEARGLADREATEFRFTLSRTTVKAGPAIIQLAIRGEDPHDLRLVRRGQTKARTAAVVPETLPGAVADWRGTLTRGKWTLYCSLPGHKAAGMRASLTVR